MKPEQHYIDNAKKLHNYLLKNDLPSDLYDLLYNHLEYSQIMVKQLSEVDTQSLYNKDTTENTHNQLKQAGFFNSDNVDPLKLCPCPFCGCILKKMTDKKTGYVYYVHPADGCYLECSIVGSEPEEIDRWNKRTSIEVVN